MSRKADHATTQRVLMVIRSNPGATYREIGHIIGLRSPSVVAYHVKKLQSTGAIQRGPARSHRTTHYNNSPETRAKKAAGGRKARILQQKGAAGLDAKTLKRIEKIGKREDARRQEHSTDVIFDLHVRSHSLKCQKLG